MDDNNKYAYLHFLPDNYTNSGRLFGGMISIAMVMQLGMIYGGFYALTIIILQNVVTSSVLMGIRISFGIFLLVLSTAVASAFNDHVLTFVLTLSDYIRLTKKYRYERRDAGYARKKHKDKN